MTDELPLEPVPPATPLPASNVAWVSDPSPGDAPERAAPAPDAAPPAASNVAWVSDPNPGDAPERAAPPRDEAPPAASNVAWVSDPSPGDAPERAAPAPDAAPPAELPPDESIPGLMERCERRIGYVFANKSLLREALTHASGAEHRLASNERLEFLGDAILGAVVCELLFEQYPKFLEGDLTKIKSSVVSRQSCAKISEALGLQEFLIVGKGMGTTHGIPPSLLADVFESLVAAIHLDGGIHAARRFIDEFLGPEIELTVTGELGGNYKSLLQQFAQREFSSTPHYELLDEKGPDHRKCFKVAARVGKLRYPAAWGRNKKEAEQRAACNALAEINGEPPQFPSD